MKNVRLAQMAVVCVALVVSGCGKEIVRKNTRVIHRDGSAADQEQAKREAANGKDSAAISLRDLQAAFGMRSFAQVLETMSVLTGVDPSTANVAQVYGEVKAQLPTTNDIKTFLASHQVGVSKLAVEFCDNMLNDANARGQRVPGFNFAAGPQTAFQGSGKAALITGLTSTFWGEGLTTLPDEDTVQNTLEQLIDNLNAGSDSASSTTTLNTAKGVCSAVLSAAPVMIL